METKLVADSLLVMPKLGFTMTEGILSEWLIEPGGGRAGAAAVPAHGCRRIA